VGAGGFSIGATGGKVLCGGLHGDFITDMWASAPSGSHISGKVIVSMTVENLELIVGSLMLISLLSHLSNTSS